MRRQARPEPLLGCRSRLDLHLEAIHLPLAEERNVLVYTDADRSSGRAAAPGGARGAPMHRRRTFLLLGGAAVTAPAVYVDTPADIRVVRKTLRKIRQGQDPVPGPLGYGASHRSYARHVAPTRVHAGIVLDGTRTTADLAEQLRAHLAAEQR